MKILLIIIWYIFFIFTPIYAEPEIMCNWLPWCDSGWSLSNSSDVLDFIGDLISKLIQYVAVVAVLALIVAGFMYIFSAWDDTKAKNARKWIIRSLIAVLISVSASLLINLINDANINF